MPARRGTHDFTNGPESAPHIFGAASGSSGFGASGSSGFAGSGDSPEVNGNELPAGAIGPSATDYMLAGSTLTSGELLRKYSQSNEPSLRQRVAANIAAPQDVFEALANDPTGAVRIEVAKNPRIPYHVLQQLARDLSPLVRYAVAESLYTPIPILKKLENDPTPQVHQRAQRTLGNLAKTCELDAIQVEELKDLQDMETATRAQYETGMALFLHDVRSEFNLLQEALRAAQAGSKRSEPENESSETSFDARLEAGISESPAYARAMAVMQRQMEHFERTIERLVEAPDEKWDELKKAMDIAWSDLGAAWKELREEIELEAGK